MSAEPCTCRMFAASAFAVNTMIRSAVAAAFPLFTTQMFTNVGFRYPPFAFPSPRLCTDAARM